MPAPCPQVICKEQAEEEEEELSKADNDAEESPAEQHRHHISFEGPADDGDAAADVDSLVHRRRLEGSSRLTPTVRIAEQSCLVRDVEQL